MTENLKQALQDAVKDELLNEQELNTVEGGSNWGICNNNYDGCGGEPEDGE